MIGILVKKQFLEIFRGFFYNSKTNQNKPKKRTILSFVLYGVLLVGILGGLFAFMASSLCAPFVAAGMDWMYFALTGLLGIFMGVIGSVFNTSSGLYQAKDNELLLSMPVLPKVILFSRLITVFLMDAMFSILVALPTVIVYWITVPFSLKAFFGGVFFIILVMLIALFLSCLLGWVVAQIGRKLKNSAIVKVLIAVAGISLYYVLYFKAINMIQDIILNAAVYGEKIGNSAKLLVFFGKTGEGDPLAIAVLTAITLILLGITWILLYKSFYKLALDSGSEIKATYREKKAKERSVFSALLGKEFSRLKSSSNYMLNCGLGTILIIAAGIAVIIKGAMIFDLLGAVFEDRSGSVAMLICAVLCMAATMNDMVVPSVSLEGKQIWILQSSPVEIKKVLWAKIVMQLILTEIPVIFATLCSVIVYQGSPAEKLMILLFAIAFTGFNAVFGLFLGLQWPNLTWTNETIPVKQSLAVVIALFGGWVFVIVIAAAYFFLAYHLGIIIYLVILTAIMIIAFLFLRNWINHQGVDIFSKL